MDGTSIRYVNVNDRLVDSTGTVREGLFMDGLHPNVAGYQIWADSIEPKLWSLLDEKKAEKDGK